MNLKLHPFKCFRQIVSMLHSAKRDIRLLNQHLILSLSSKYIKNYKDIPIIINNFNRLEYLIRLIKSLEKRDYKNIYILDNKSTYEPLLSYYSSCPYKIIFLEKNYGHRALWESGIINQFNKDLFVYTDPDLELIEECPNDFISFLVHGLMKYPHVQKMGLSLKIDDLPDHYKEKASVISWETRFSEKKYGIYFIADIDTTFAVHKPKAPGGYVDETATLRSPYPYQARHLPWYENSNKISEEDIFYLNHKKKEIGWWSSKIMN